MEDAIRVVDGFHHDPLNGFFGIYDGHGGMMQLCSLNSIIFVL